MCTLLHKIKRNWRARHYQGCTNLSWCGIYIFIPRRLGNGWCIKMIYPCCVGVIYPFRGRNYPCLVCLIDLLRIRASQRDHVAKEVGLKFVFYNILKIVLQKMH